MRRLGCSLALLAGDRVKSGNLSGFAAIADGKLLKDTFSATEVGAITRVIRKVETKRWRKGITIKIVPTVAELITVESD